MPRPPAELSDRAARVRLLLFDVDGVFTDGTVVVRSDGAESKRYDIRDGMGIALAHRAGLRTGLLSARSSGATTHRAAELDIPIVRQEGVDKIEAYLEILSAEGLVDAEVCYMGDDLLDLPVLGRAGLSAAPADAVEEVRRRVHWVSGRPGGRGAVRELVELILRAQGRWDELVRPFLGEPRR